MSEAPHGDNSHTHRSLNYFSLPEPTSKWPMAQVEAIFDRVMAAKSKPSTKRNYKNAKSFFLEHLHVTGFKGPYYLQREWDSLALIRFRQELERRIDRGELQYASYTLIGLFSAIRYVMNYAATRGLAGCTSILDASYGSGAPETNTYAAYTDNELTQILNVIASELSISRKLLSGYVPQPANTGRDPRISPHKGPNRGYGFAVEANMRWYFENVLLCTPAHYDDDGKAHHLRFINSGTNNFGGLNELYRRWGISTCIDLDMIMPHVINLAYLTGLNPGPLCALSADAYGDSHPCHGGPYLRYVKDKVSRELELYLDLLDKNEKSENLDSNVLQQTSEKFYPRKQATQISRSFRIIQQATEPLRRNLPEGHPLKNRLFIHATRRTANFGDIQGISPRKTNLWCNKKVEHYGLVGEDGDPLQFNLVKFRSTKLTELALQGRDLLEIQIVAGHRSVRTTIGYLARNKIEVEARKIVRDALLTIHENRQEYANSRDSFSQSGKKSPEKIMHLYKGMLSDCKNPFAPPKRVLALRNYSPDQGCSRFNMCLFCHNVVVFRHNLPTLVAYLAQIEAARQSNLQHLPNFGFYEDTMMVIKELLSPERGEFSREDIEWAKQEASHLNPLIDAAVFRGVIGDD